MKGRNGDSRKTHTGEEGKRFVFHNVIFAFGFPFFPALENSGTPWNSGTVLLGCKMDGLPNRFYNLAVLWSVCYRCLSILHFKLTMSHKVVIRWSTPSRQEGPFKISVYFYDTHSLVSPGNNASLSEGRQAQYETRVAMQRELDSARTQVLAVFILLSPRECMYLCSL